MGKRMCLNIGKGIAYSTSRRSLFSPAEEAAVEGKAKLAL
jgi:hypothetical protein